MKKCPICGGEMRFHNNAIWELDGKEHDYYECLKCGEILRDELIKNEVI